MGISSNGRGRWWPTPTASILLTAMREYKMLSGRNEDAIECILISFDDCRLLERELSEFQASTVTSPLLSYAPDVGLRFQGVQLIRTEREPGTFIFVMKGATTGNSITMTLEEYNLRTSSMSISFNTTMDFAEEKVKESSPPPTKTSANIRRRKLRWD